MMENLEKALLNKQRAMRADRNEVVEKWNTSVAGLCNTVRGWLSAWPERSESLVDIQERFTDTYEWQLGHYTTPGLMLSFKPWMLKYPVYLEARGWGEVALYRKNRVTRVIKMSGVWSIAILGSEPVSKFKPLDESSLEKALIWLLELEEPPPSSQNADDFARATLG